MDVVSIGAGMAGLTAGGCGWPLVQGPTPSPPWTSGLLVQALERNQTASWRKVRV